MKVVNFANSTKLKLKDAMFIPFFFLFDFNREH